MIVTDSKTAATTKRHEHSDQNRLTTTATIDFGCVPPELTERPQWVLWKSQARNGEATKIPYSVTTGNEAKSNDSETWAAFDSVVGKYDESQHSGIGFVFSADDPFIGVDLDGCRHTDGTLEPWANQIVEELDSYTEVSPSGTGVKIWMVADQIPTGKNKKLPVPKICDKDPGIECYAKARYFAVTGNVMPGRTAIRERRDEFRKLFETHFGKPTEHHRTATSNASSDIADRARKYIAKMEPAVSGEGGHNQTFHVACVLVQGFELSRSESLALLAEWNQLCQPPWSDKDLEHKIDDALKLPGERGYLRNASNERAITGPINTTDYRRYGVADSNDIGNARHFVSLHGDKLRYCFPWRKWFVWDGTRWKLDDCGAPMRMAKETATQIFHDGLTRVDDKVLKLAVDTARASNLRSMIALAEPDLPIRVDEMDVDGWLLNCQNGTVDLRTGKLEPHKRCHHITKLCPTSFEPTATAPKWEQFLRDIFCDDYLISFVQRLLGYCMTADVSEQRLPIFYGSGANGKSTLLNAFMDVVGTDYTMQSMPDFLMEKRGEAHPTERASLFGKRFVSCVETESSRKLAESTVKMLTGGEKIMARRMREDFWQFEPSHKLVLCTNHKPIVVGNDHGIWRRLLLVPFSQRFEGNKIDKQLPDKLRNEAAGILAWLVRGCIEWQRDGLNPPDVVTTATDEYRTQEDIIGRFMAERCERAKSDSVRFSVLYATFERWADDAGDFCPTKRKVGTWLNEQGYKRFTANGTCYRGLSLKPDTGSTE